ncbi:MAG: DNA polymerase III subunit gamma/tau [Acidobacteriota bacterium]
MSYVVIARKFRPVQFPDVVGQEVVTRTLTNALSLGRVAHAYLFSGTRGVGKTTTARLLAKCLNCAKGVSSTPCDECPSCREIGAGGAIDVLEIDGASNRGINEVRELRESARYTPARDRHKIFIIDEVHMLTSEAFNALLKTLEEPPRHVVFILATTEREKVPATILSRCQKLDFRRLGTEEISASLEKTCVAMNTTIDVPALHALARAADGSMRDAQSLLEQVMAYAKDGITKGDVDAVLGSVPRAIVEDTLRAILDGDAPGVLSAVDRLYESGQDPRAYVTSLLEAHRDLIVIATGSRKKSVLTEEEISRSRRSPRGRSSFELLRCASSWRGWTGSCVRRARPGTCSRSRSSRPRR